MISDWASSLREAYPNPNNWAQFGKLAKRDVFRFTRLWLTEGIPFAFRDRPILYELGRERLARVLDDDPKHVSLAGSARLGFSLAEKKFGQAFAKSSDLDVFLVSPAMFQRLSMDAQLFIDRFQSGLAKPETVPEKKYWPANATELPLTMQSGFIDSWRVPAFDRYPAFQAVSHGLTALRRVLEPGQKDVWSVESLSLRTYENWDRAVAHIGGSLWKTLIALKLAD